MKFAILDVSSVKPTGKNLVSPVAILYDLVKNTRYLGDSDFLMIPVDVFLYEAIWLVEVLQRGALFEVNTSQTSITIVIKGEYSSLNMLQEFTWFQKYVTSFCIISQKK